MAISRSVPPTLWATGHLVRKSVLRRKVDKSEYGTALTLSGDDGSQLAVQVMMRDDAYEVELPSIGEFVAIKASVEESRDFGASLRFVEFVTPGDLDLLHSNLTPSGK